MNEKIIHRPFTISDKASVLDLMNLIYPRYSYDDAFFNWQYLDNPAGKAKIFLSQSGRSVIGMYTLIPNDLISEKKKIKNLAGTGCNGSSRLQAKRQFF